MSVYTVGLLGRVGVVSCRRSDKVLFNLNDDL